MPSAPPQGGNSTFSGRSKWDVRGPPPAGAAVAPGAAAWRHHEGVNCYEGNGAMRVPAKSPLPGRVLLGECQSACEAEDACQGVVMLRHYVHTGIPYLCWLRMGLDISACNQKTDYDLWERVPAASTHQSGSTSSLARPSNVYAHSTGVGGWGGWCTCPDGQRYNVGDLNDGCANGPASLACFGGNAGQCERKEEAARKGMKVTCAQP